MVINFMQIRSQQRMKGVNVKDPAFFTSPALQLSTQSRRTSL
jgi:hypothetical protein